MDRAVLISLQTIEPQTAGVQQGALAQLGERLICIQEVRSSILLGSTKHTALVLTIPGRPFSGIRFCEYPARATSILRLQNQLGR